ncbi:hypothetical protein SLA2020_374700, partial [Shorea laevis]
EFRWYVWFGVVYVLVGNAALLNVVLPVMDMYNKRSVLYLYISMVLCEALFGVLLLVHVPNLNLYVGYLIMQNEFPDNVDYEAHSVDEQICPERQANIFSRIYFGWITPLMQKGYRRPITEKDVWKLDTWDQTETLMKKFVSCSKEFGLKKTQRKKPWLLRALNNSLGVRFWLGGLFKIGFDLSLFVGPLLLNHLLKSMEQGDPACIGYIYAFLFFVGVVCFLSSQDYQNVYRVGFRLQSTLVAAIFQKSLRLTHEARKNFHSGRITNMITTDPSAVEQMCQPLHGLWSAPFRIIMSMVLLYQQLGVASLLGALILVLMVPAQERKAIIVSKMRKMTKEGLQWTDKKVSLMNEILTAMNTELWLNLIPFI